MSEMGMAMMGTGSAAGENRAREAAEAAIRSPLLEDVDLNGARGILVNVTAGLDLNIGEFTEVGRCVEEFASPDATVVVGTVIDQTLQDEIKVTVVATGLGKASVPNVVVDNTVVEPTASGLTDYDKLDTPAYVRKPLEKPTQHLDASQSKDMEYLDIPAFLRRQAD
jgi:cell division protein FtsZ